MVQQLANTWPGHYSLIIQAPGGKLQITLNEAENIIQQLGDAVAERRAILALYDSMRGPEKEMYDSILTEPQRWEYLQQKYLIRTCHTK